MTIFMKMSSRNEKMNKLKKLFIPCYNFLSRVKHYFNVVLEVYKGNTMVIQYCILYILIFDKNSVEKKDFKILAESNERYFYQ